MGPDALRTACLQRALERLGLEVCDCGNLVGPRNPWRAPESGYRHLPEVAHWVNLVHEAVLVELRRQRLPVLLGGDHSLSIGSISAAARHCREKGRALRVLWLDAHADFNTNELSPTGNLHGMPVACLCGLGPPALVGVSGRVPAIHLDEIYQVGIRSVDEGERQLMHEQRLMAFDMRFIDERGVCAAIDGAMMGIDGNTHLHVSFDVDFLDPETAPGVGTPVPGGWTYREAQLCMEMIADTHRLGSLDIVELNPMRDRRNRTASLMVELIQSLFGKSTLFRDTQPV